MQLNGVDVKYENANQSFDAVATLGKSDIAWDKALRNATLESEL